MIDVGQDLLIRIAQALEDYKRRYARLLELEASKGPRIYEAGEMVMAAHANLRGLLEQHETFTRASNLRDPRVPFEQIAKAVPPPEPPTPDVFTGPSRVVRGQARPRKAAP